MAAKKGAQAAPAKTPDQTAMYGDEYKQLFEALRTPTFRKAVTKYCEARRKGAGETMLFPSMTTEQLQVIRGKAQAFFELLAMCEAAATDEGED